MKVLVTGTAGFIGNHLAIKLLERGDEVVGVDNLNDYYDVNLKLARLDRIKDHANLLISELILLIEQQWRNCLRSISRNASLI